MLKSWLVDGRTIARGVRTSGLLSLHQNKDCGAYWECPQCSCRIDNSYVSIEWPGLPIGVKFDPSDVELLGHLAAKCGVGNEHPHPYMDEFIPTLDVEEGICYEHPENLPGSRKDGNSIHFFYRTTNAYARGQRKRRKICNGSSSTTDVRWHKTGKSRAIFKNGVQIGCKKIMVLYSTAVGGSKPCKANWVMHQYHLGTNEDEKDGEYVVSKIFYQAQKRTDIHVDESDASMSLTSPRTPKADAPDPPRPGRSLPYVDNDGQLARVVDAVAKLITKEGKSATLNISSSLEVCLRSKNCSATYEQMGNIGVNQRGVTSEYGLQSPAQESELKYLPSFSTAEVKDDVEAYDTDLDESHDSFLGLDNHPLSDSSLFTNNAANFETIDLKNLDLGAPPVLNLAELYFPSQDDFFAALDWL